jgi:hypothetical protein
MVGKGGIMEAIRAKMNWVTGPIQIIVQQDGAPVHNGKGNDIFFVEYGSLNEPHIKVITQPANSPDLNVNDLGFYRSLKSHVDAHKAIDASLENMVASVHQEFEDYLPSTLTRIWAHLLNCYREIIRSNGDNIYKEPHRGVNNHQRDNIQCLNFGLEDEY